MAPLTVHIKHAGKIFDVPLDVAQPAVVFKESIYQVTGVPVDRMKVMVKGGMLKVWCHQMMRISISNLSCCRMIMIGRKLDQRRGRHSW